MEPLHPQRELHLPEQRSPAIADLQKQTSPPAQPQEQRHEKVKLREINPYLTCHLCRGYLIDATTISECLHSFCRSCIIKFLEDNSFCPVCEVIINKAKPNLKLDKTLQDIVYKLVPGLFLAEMLRRKRFYAERPEVAGRVSPEQRGEDTERTIFNPQDRISLSLEYIGDAATSGIILKDLKSNLQKQQAETADATSDSTTKKSNSQSVDVQEESLLKRYLQCPGMCRIDVIKKFIRNKYNVNTDLFQIDILYKRVPLALPDHYTLIDVAYIYTWKRNEPMRFYFRIIEKGNDELPDLSKVFTPIDAPPLLRPQARSTPIKKLTRTLSTPDAKDRKKRTPKKNNAARKVATPKFAKKEDYKNCDKDTIESESNSEVKNEVDKDDSPKRPRDQTNSDKTFNAPLVDKTNQNDKIDVIKNELEINSDIKSSSGEINEESDTKVKFSNKETVKKQVYTNITLNRSNNLEIITKIHKVSDKDGQQIGMNIINKTVKKTNSLDVKNNAKVQNISSTLMPAEVDTEIEVEKEIPVLEPEIPLIKKEIITIKEEPPVLKQEIKETETNSPSGVNQLTETELEQKKFEFLKSIELTSRKVVDNLAKLMQKQQAKSLAHQQNKASVSSGSAKSCLPMKTPLSQAALEILKTKKLIAPKPGTNGIKRKNSSPMKSESKKPKVESKRTTKIIIQQKPGYPAINPVKPNEIPKLCDNVLNQNKKDLHSLFQNCRLNIPSSLSITLKENGETSRKPVQMPPVQNYIEILKIDEKEGKKTITLKREDATSLKNPTSASKRTPEPSQTAVESTSTSYPCASLSAPVNNKIPPKQTIALPKASPSGTAEYVSKPKETKDGLTKAQQQQQSFQKIFEESIKKSDVDSASTDIGTDILNSSGKRNILEIAQQLYKKTKIEQDSQKKHIISTSEADPLSPTPITGLNVPKVAIPRLNNQRVVKAPKRNQKYESLPHQTLTNLHSSSLGLNYTVSVGKQTRDPVQHTYKVNGVLSPKEISPSNGSNGSRNINSSPMKSDINIEQSGITVDKNSTHPSGETSPAKSNPVSPRNLDLKMPSGRYSPKIPKVPHSPRPSIASPVPKAEQVPPPSPKHFSPRNYSAKTPQSSPKSRSNNASPKLAQSAGSSSVSSTSSPALTPNQLLEKYKIQNLAQLSASINFNAASVPQNYLNAVQGTQMAALHQAMLMKQFEMQNRQKWLNINQGPLLQFEKYLQSLNASKNQILGNIKDN